MAKVERQMCSSEEKKKRGFYFELERKMEVRYKNAGSVKGPPFEFSRDLAFVSENGDRDENLR